MDGIIFADPYNLWKISNIMGFSEDAGMIQMEVVGVAPEPNSNKPLVWLRDEEQTVFLPISIGNFEATAIYMELYDEPPPRPICYDLVRTVLGQVNAKVERIVISDLKDDTFYAQIIFKQGSSEFEVDSRPSDAIALALRVAAPIFASDAVLDEAGLEVEGEEIPLGLEEDMELFEAAAEAELVVQEEPESVVTLQKQLEAAVSQEDYEKAAKLRDKIGRMDAE
ncbi:MAG: hypothetical protein CME19_03590 [Gemmatimonadetes bacterium]|nr:hypothetical protein [Gemmatimonadota bacterium]|tara:strand:- start:147 stop:818 length:672 start_codon:yes stop_codon:yes gene_type:complete